MLNLGREIYEFVAKNPGCTTAEIKGSLQKEDPKRVESQIRRMSGRNIRRVSSDRKYSNRWAVV